MQAQSSSDGKVHGVGERDRVNAGDPDDDRLAQLDLYVDGVTSDARNPPNREAQGGLWRYFSRAETMTSLAACPTIAVFRHVGVSPLRAG